MKILKIAENILLYANIIIIALMMITGYSGFINPAEHKWLAMIGYTFPVFLIANILFVVIWLMIKSTYLIVPAVGFILNFVPVQNFSPVNIYDSPSADAIKIMSYNVLAFSQDQAEPDKPNPILEQIVLSNADIVCVQEYAEYRGQDSLNAELHKQYPYFAKVNTKGPNGDEAGGDAVAVLSRFPIESSENLDIVTRGNTVGIFTLDIKGEKVIVINAHLETVGFSHEEKSEFAEMVKAHKDRHTTRSESKNLMRKVADATAVRAAQADMINDFIKAHKDSRIIFCGDINDHPLSYVHNTIAENLNDCYRAAGHWFDYTMNRDMMFVRIDHIMTTDHWKAYDCSIDKSVNMSDHYPISCFLESKY